MAIEVFNQRTHPERFTLTPLQDATVAIIGYGNQGRAQALCLRDSGIHCIAGTRPSSKAAAQARADGFAVHSIAEASAAADLIIISLPDEVHGEVFHQQVEPALRCGVTVGFLHGYSVRFGLVKPGAGTGVVLVAPKGPGVTLRALFEAGHGLPALYAIHQDSARGDSEALAFAWATAIGAGRSGVIATTFAAEAETDLFGEQAVLCGGVLGLMLAAFETLVDAGYEPELAYLECCHEVKQVADLLYARGPSGMAEAISNTAEFGAYRSAPLIVDEQVRRRLRLMLESIRSGEFAEVLRADGRDSFEWFLGQRSRLREHPIDRAGAAIRALMPWLHEGGSA